jgi:hypothetical protein
MSSSKRDCQKLELTRTERKAELERVDTPSVSAGESGRWVECTGLAATVDSSVSSHSRVASTSMSLDHFVGSIFTCG